MCRNRSENRFMGKGIGAMRITGMATCVAAMLALSLFGEMTETQRMTACGVEWLYTADYEAGRIVLEKGIVLSEEQGDVQFSLSAIIHGAYNNYLFRYDESGALLDYKLDNIYITFGVGLFEGNEYIRSIGIEPDLWRPEGVHLSVYLSIERNAFKGCVNFCGIRVGNSSNCTVCLTSIGDSAFEGCGYFASDMGTIFDYEDSLWHLPLSGLTNVGSRVFYGIEGGWRQEIRLPESLRTLGSYAFENCGVFDKIYLPSSIKEIPEGAFKDCWVGRIVFPETGITAIGERAFQGLRGRHGYEDAIELAIPEGVEELGVSAFGDFKDYANTLKLPETLRNIPHGCFAGHEYYDPYIRDGQPWNPMHYDSRLSGEVRIPGAVTDSV